MTSFRIYQGFADQILDTFKENTIDCIFTSPSPPRFGGDVVRLLQVFYKCKRVVKPTGRIWININNQWRHQQTGGILHMSEVFLLRMASECGWVNSDNIIWWRWPHDKSKPADPKRFYKDWEDIYSFVHSTREAYFNDKLGLHGSSIIACPTEHFKPGEFKSGFPELVIEKLLRATTRPGDVVMDPFMGTATTGVAALKLGRHFVGIDSILNDTYRQAVEQRLNKYRYDVQKMQP